MFRRLSREVDADVSLRQAARQELGRRTLITLYNEPPTWRRDLHAALGAAVLAGYGLPAEAGQGTVINHLLALNPERSRLAVV